MQTPRKTNALLAVWMCLTVLASCSDDPAPVVPDATADAEHDDVGDGDGDGDGDMGTTTSSDMAVRSDGGAVVDGGMPRDFGGEAGVPWVEVTPQLRAPDPTHYTAMAHDRSRDTVVLFGGVDSRGTWEWNGTRWFRNGDLDTEPPRRSRHTLVYDSAREEIVLFGGADRTMTALSDTWTYDGSAWTQKAVGAGPPARWGHAVAYDSTRERIVMYGGRSDNSTVLDDLWEWDGTSWSEITATGPGELTNHGMAYDPSRQRTVLFGGDGEGLIQRKIWEWDGSAWTELEVLGATGRVLFSMTYDERRGGVVVVGGTRITRVLGDTWLWDGTTWTDLTDDVGQLEPTLGHGLTTWDDGLLLFGGDGNTGPRGKTLWLDDVWTDLSPNVSAPRGRIGNALAWDSGNEAVVMYGGVNSISGYEEDTWLWDGTNWMDVTPEGDSPRGREWHRMMHDPLRGDVILFGGSRGGQPMGETWRWDGATWTELQPATSPSARRSHAMVWDADNEVILVYGGIAAEAGEQHELWEWDGTTWTQRPTPELTPPWSAGAPVGYHRDTGVAVALMDGTWVYDGGVWTMLLPSEDSPSRRSFARLSWDPARRSLILFGSGSDTWEFDGGAWTELTPEVTAPSRQNHDFVADPTRGRLVLFGGGDDTWEWNGSVARPASP